MASLEKQSAAVLLSYNRIESKVLIRDASPAVRKSCNERDPDLPLEYDTVVETLGWCIRPEVLYIIEKESWTCNKYVPYLPLLQLFIY